MKHSRQTSVAQLTVFLIALAVASSQSAAADAEDKRTKAIDKLAFAVEEIDIVVRAAEQGTLPEAQKQYKRARSYFLDAMKGIRGAKPSQTKREQTEIFEDRFRKLDRGAKDLDEETVRAVAGLFHEAHEYFDPNASR